MKTLATLCAILAVGASTATYSVDSLYSLSTTVTAVSETEVVCTDFNGNNWVFTNEDGDWFVGDIASLTMYDNGTPEIEDDIILKTTYCGWVF